MIVEGARVRKGAQIGPGLIFTATVPVGEAENGHEGRRGVVPEAAGLVAGTRIRGPPSGGSRRGSRSFPPAPS